ncbi:MAG: glycosyl hydrolase family 18 protein [Bacteroidota bacterium]
MIPRMLNATCGGSPPTRRCLLFLLLLVACVPGFSQYRIIGYYPMWSRSALPPQAMKFVFLTHVMHAFAWPQADGSIAFGEGTVDTALIHATHRAGRKILLSFGGAAQSGAFAQVAADSALRRAFIDNVVAHLTAYEYDGADMDWEGPQNAAERANEATLIRELHEAFRAADTSWIITMAVGVTNWSGQWHDFASLRISVAWFNAMTYDFHGSWSSHAGHNAPLYVPAWEYDGSVDQGIRYLNETRGIPASQLALGLPFYGRNFLATALYAPKTEPTTDVTYSDIPAKLAHNWAYTWDPVAQVPYLIAPSGTQLTTFDDTTSLVLKCAYAKAKGLSGVMIWALGQDLVAGQQVLLDAVGRTMGGPSRTDDGDPLARSFVLYQNYPNPFNPSTTIRYSLERRRGVRLAVYDAIGQEVAMLVNGTMEAGTHEVRFDGSRSASGVYFCRMFLTPDRGGEPLASVQTVKLILLR